MPDSLLSAAKWSWISPSLYFLTHCRGQWDSISDWICGFRFSFKWKREIILKIVSDKTVKSSHVKIQSLSASQPTDNGEGKSSMMGIIQINLDEINRRLMLLRFPTRRTGINHILLCIIQKERSVRNVRSEKNKSLSISISISLQRIWSFILPVLREMMVFLFNGASVRHNREGKQIKKGPEKKRTWKLNSEIRSRSVWPDKQLHNCTDNHVWDLLRNLKAEGPHKSRLFNPETAEYRGDFLTFISVDLVNTPAAPPKMRKRDDLKPFSQSQEPQMADGLEVLL